MADQDDPEAAMRAMMGFSNFTTSGSKGGRKDKSDSAPTPPRSASGANAAPLAKRLKTNNGTSSSAFQPNPLPKSSYSPFNGPSLPTTIPSSADTNMTDPPPPRRGSSPFIPPAMYPPSILPSDQPNNRKPSLTWELPPKPPAVDLRRKSPYQRSPVVSSHQQAATSKGSTQSVSSTAAYLYKKQHGHANSTTFTDNASNTILSDGVPAEPASTLSPTTSSVGQSAAATTAAAAASDTDTKNVTLGGTADPNLSAVMGERLPSPDIGIEPFPKPKAVKTKTYNAATGGRGIAGFIPQDIRFAPPPSPEDHSTPTNLPNTTPAPATDLAAAPGPLVTTGVEVEATNHPKTKYGPGKISNPQVKKYYGRDNENYEYVNEKDDQVYFKVSFVVDDPWQELKDFRASQRMKAVAQKEGKR